MYTHARTHSGSIPQPVVQPPSAFRNGPPPPITIDDPFVGVDCKARPVPSVCPSTHKLSQSSLKSAYIQVPPPALHRPSDEDLFVVDGQRRLNHEYLKTHFLREGRLREQQALYIIEKATSVLSRESNLVSITSPVTSECPAVFLFQPVAHSSLVCGDIHGQYVSTPRSIESISSPDTSFFSMT